MNVINKIERVRRTFAGLKTDRVPVMLYRHFFDQNEDNSVNDYVQWAKETDIDILLVQVDGFDGLPINNVSGSINDFCTYPEITKNHPFIQGQVDRVKRIFSELKDTAIYGLLYTPYNNIKKTAKYSFESKINIDNEFYKENKVIDNTMEFAQKCNDILLEEYYKIGIEGVMISLRNGGNEAIPSDIYRKRLLQWDEHLVSKANSYFKNNIIHYCAWYGKNDLSLWSHLESAGINWDTHVEQDPVTNEIMTITKANDYFDKNITLIAGFNNRANSLIYSNDEETIKATTKKYISEARGRKFIIGADCSIDSSISSETIRWIIEAAKI